MSRIITALFAIFLLINGINCIDFTDCGSTSGKVLSIAVTNCPRSSDACDFKTGTNASVDVQFVSETNSKSATVKVWGVIGGVPIPFNLKPSDACGNWNIECPVTSGTNYDLKISLPILSRYPKIKVDVRIALIDEDSNKLICQQFPAQIE